MPKVSDLPSRPEFLKVLIYGESGTGKTYSISTFPDPVYIFDFDRGIETLSGITPGEFEYDTYAEGSIQGQPFVQFRKKVAELRKKCPYKTVVLDSVTTLGEKAVTSFVRSASGHMETPLELQDHLKISDKLSQALDELLGIQANIVVISHPKVIITEETGEIKYLVMQTGNKLPQRVPLIFDEIYKAERKDSAQGEPKYTWQTKSDRKWPARSRFNYIDKGGIKRAVLDSYEEPNLTAILEKVEKARS